MFRRLVAGVLFQVGVGDDLSDGDREQQVGCSDRLRISGPMLAGIRPSGSCLLFSSFPTRVLFVFLRGWSWVIEVAGIDQGDRSERCCAAGGMKCVDYCQGFACAAACAAEVGFRHHQHHVRVAEDGELVGGMAGVVGIVGVVFDPADTGAFERVDIGFDVGDGFEEGRAGYLVCP